MNELANKGATVISETGVEERNGYQTSVREPEPEMVTEVHI